MSQNLWKRNFVELRSKFQEINLVSAFLKGIVISSKYYQIVNLGAMLVQRLAYNE